MRVRVRSAWQENENLQWCFHLAPSTPLPTVDLARSLKSRFLPKVWLPKMHSFMSRYSALLSYGYGLSAMLSFAVPLVKVEVGRPMSVFAIVLSTPLALLSLGSLRYEMARLLMCTYDYWFFTCANLFTLVFCSLYFNDFRIFRGVMDWIGFQNLILADAQLRGIGHMTIVTLVALVGTLMFLAVVALNRVDAPHQLELIQFSNEFKTYNISVADCLINGLGTMAMLLAKIGYQKAKAVRKNRLESVIECAVFKCRLKITPCASRFKPPLQSIMCDPSLSSTQLRRKRSMSVQPLLYIGKDRVFDSRNIFLPVKIASLCRFPWVVLAFIYSVGLGGLIISFMALTHVDSLHIGEEKQFPPSDNGGSHGGPDHEGPMPNGDWLSMAINSWSALIATLLFSLIFGSLYQRDLLQAVVTSFDFVFFSIQVTAAHLSICVLFDWRSFQCYGVLTSWLWIHWVLTLDALTPMMKAKLRFHVQFAVPVVAMVTIGQITLLHGIVYRDSGPMDKTLLNLRVFGHLVSIRVIPFFTGRLVTILLWSIRLLFRLVRASNEEVVILRGAVAFRNYISFASRNGPPPRSEVMRSWATKSPRRPESSFKQRGSIRKDATGNRSKVRPVPQRTDLGVKFERESSN